MSPRDRRVLWIGAAIVAAAIVALRLAPSVVGGVRAARERLDARSELLARMRADLRDAPKLEDSAEVVRKRIAGLAGQILGPGTEAEAAASLGALISMAAERRHVRLSRTESVPDSARAGPARRVSVHAVLESDTAGLLGLLAALAEGPAAVTVGILTVNADTSLVANGPELLHTDITVRGWYLPRVGGRGT